MNRTLAFAAAALVLVTTPACLSSFMGPRPTVVNVPLEVQPSDNKANVTTWPPKLQLYVEQVVDERADKTAKIGENIEKPDAKVPIMAASMSPSDFVGRLATADFAKNGVKLAGNAQEANRFLRIRLTKFFTTEENTYVGEVTAVVELRDTSGAVIFTATVTGTAKHFGHSLDVSNYKDTFNNATEDLVNNLIDNAEFQKAVGITGAPGSAAAATGQSL